MQKRKVLSLMLATAMLASTLTGCGSKPADAPAAPAEEKQEAPAEENKETPAEDSEEATAGEAAIDNSEFVELNFYMSNGPLAEQERIMEKANAIIKDKINAKLNLVTVDPGTYAEKINLMINSGEEFDLCFMANWGGTNFYENAGKGAFIDMTPLFETYAPQTYARIPEALWDGVKIDGKIMASVNYQQWGVAARKGFCVRMDLAEKYGFDWKAMKGKTALEVMNMLTPLWSRL